MLQIGLIITEAYYIFLRFLKKTCTYLHHKLRKGLEKKEI